MFLLHMITQEYTGLSVAYGNMIYIKPQQLNSLWVRHCRIIINDTHGTTHIYDLLKFSHTVWLVVV
jgi:hypothetical protein